MHLPDASIICDALPHLHDLSPLAQGGQKMVYRGRHDDYGEVVVKLILSATANERTRREIEAVTAWQFPNVPKIYDSGVIKHTGGETTYLIEQYIQGKTLRAVLEQHDRLKTEDALGLLRTLLTTAVELEARQMVHRDIKPENILVDVGGKYWLLDFGIARHLDKTSLTATVARFGPATVGYAAPEQLRNIKKQIDIRADLFSIGVVMYEMLSGTHPFRDGARDQFEILRRTESASVLPLTIPGDTQKQLSGLINALMAHQLSRRPKSAQQAMEWLTALIPTLNIHTSSEEV